MRHITLSGSIDLEGFRRNARELLLQQIPPEQITWHNNAEPTQDLFSCGDATATMPNVSALNDAHTVRVSPEFASLCASVILHNDPNRFGLMDRLLWRLKT